MRDALVMTTVRRSLEVSAGDWIAERLVRDWSKTVPAGAVAPAGFDRLVRVFHPAGDDNPRTWAEVAAEQGRVMHPLAQWCGIYPPFDGTSWTSEVDPESGSMPPTVQEAILEHCPAAADVFYAVWVGFGFWEEADHGPTVRGRGGHRLFTGPKAVLSTWPGMERTWRKQSANLIWPPDRSWCIATDIDWDSTLVAGDSALAEALLSDPRLEAAEVAHTDDLSWSGDHLNPRPPWLD